MGKMTFVVEFDDGTEPPVHAAMDIQGGRLVAAAFHDYRDDFLTPEQRDVVLMALSKLSCEEIETSFHAEIIYKAELLTY
ncbi:MULTISPECIES: hypothetical protein [Citrobacter]|nr:MULTISPECIES: hypothetical protein [Citrobacter]AMG55233.1 hypothetical protein AL524_20315 [Citrobacter amalonaticus]MCX3394492.1 hypothetical protein [Citrobacter amalonaticus]MDQ2174134.1 hypothetical protein [Citrobacter amalonaticus]TKU44064.1 hypothetical protein FDX24_05775 [Citrobacter sp. wls716]